MGELLTKSGQVRDEAAIGSICSGHDRSSITIINTIITIYTGYKKIIKYQYFQQTCHWIN